MNTSSRRRMKRLTCTSKTAYETEEAAWVAAAKTSLWNGKKYKFYNCSYCKKYHLTTKV